MFPLLYSIQWTARPESEGVTGYRILVNGVLVGTVPGTATSIPYTLSGPGIYTAQNIAINPFGESAPGLATLNALPPGTPLNTAFVAVPLEG